MTVNLRLDCHRIEASEFESDAYITTFTGRLNIFFKSAYRLLKIPTLLREKIKTP